MIKKKTYKNRFSIEEIKEKIPDTILNIPDWANKDDDFDINLLTRINIDDPLITNSPIFDTLFGNIHNETSIKFVYMPDCYYFDKLITDIDSIKSIKKADAFSLGELIARGKYSSHSSTLKELKEENIVFYEYSNISSLYKKITSYISDDTLKIDSNIDEQIEKKLNINIIPFLKGKADDRTRYLITCNLDFTPQFKQIIISTSWNCPTKIAYDRQRKHWENNCNVETKRHLNAEINARRLSEKDRLEATRICLNKQTPYDETDETERLKIKYGFYLPFGKNAKDLWHHRSSTKKDGRDPNNRMCQDEMDDSYHFIINPKAIPKAKGGARKTRNKYHRRRSKRSKRKRTRKRRSKNYIRN